MVEKQTAEMTKNWIKKTLLYLKILYLKERNL